MSKYVYIVMMRDARVAEALAEPVSYHRTENSAKAAISDYKLHDKQAREEYGHMYKLRTFKYHINAEELEG